MPHKSHFIRILAAGFALIAANLSACGNGDPPLPQLMTPSAATAKSEISSIAAYASEYGPGPNFATAEYLDGSSAGLIGDGKTDNTAAFRTLLGDGNRTIHVSAGNYVTGKLIISHDTAILLEPGVVIRDSGRLGPTDRLINILANDVYIDGYGAKIVGDRAAYSSGEQRHGVMISGASNVVINGLESSDNAGDGFYIGGPPGQPAQDVLLRACLATDNLRQGLSIVSGRRIYVVDCTFQYTHGTAPQFGIDLEPDYPTQVLEQIRILRPVTSQNAGGGVAIYLEHLDANSYPIDIQILDHLSESEWPPLDTLGSQYAPGTIQYTVAANGP